MDPRIVHAVSFVYLKRVKTLSPANIIIRGLKNLVFVFSEKNEIEETVGFFFYSLRHFLTLQYLNYTSIYLKLFLYKKIAISRYFYIFFRAFSFHYLSAIMSMSN